MAVRTKYLVRTVRPIRDEDPSLGAAIILEPVVSGSPENRDFFKWTPGGSIVLSTANEKAVEQFKVGYEYYVDFTPAE